MPTKSIVSLPLLKPESNKHSAKWTEARAPIAAILNAPYISTTPNTYVRP